VLASPDNQKAKDMSSEDRKPFVIGVAGGSGSGKSTVADRVIGLAGHERVTVLALDSYYQDRSELSLDERAGLNYDHPDAFDWSLMTEHLGALRSGSPIDAPVYDFASHRRSPSTTYMKPAPIIVVEGLLVLWEPTLRALMDLRVFVDADADVRFIRRLQRDINERGRTIDSVVGQYLDTVRPAHEQFIEPSKRYADVIIPHGGKNQPALDMLLARIAQI
jgi:uridine kinase